LGAYLEQLFKDTLTNIFNLRLLPESDLTAGPVQQQQQKQKEETGTSIREEALIRVYSETVDKLMAQVACMPLSIRSLLKLIQDVAHDQVLATLHDLVWT
jgi:hypothetical protein